MSNFFKARAMEPSTWRGIGGLLVAFGLATGGQVEALVAVGAAVLSLVEVMRKEPVKVPVLVSAEAPIVG